jgi:deazaflavin-dependent oxidoreductase (nitroreductase family)
MDKTQLPDDLRALNARLTANPELTENMGPVHMLTVIGRRTGRPQVTPVSPVTSGGQRWLVAGWADADWVKNLRATGSATLTKGTRVEQIRAVEVTPEQGVPALRAFVQERAGSGRAFDLDPRAPFEAFLAESRRHPIFQILT